jgi:1,2-phenylacetyl-CoA epoxidase catalytic subunit
MPKIATFDDWVDLFRQWQEDIGVDRAVIGDYRFEAKFGELDSGEVEFGAFAGERKWDTVLQIPDQRIRDALLTYLIVQGDTEFTSVEQQRHLIATAPNDDDRHALARSMPPMLKEEAFHLGTGHNGLKRVVRAGKIPSTLIQKYVNKWVPACYDLFGTDGSSSAHRAST